MAKILLAEDDQSMRAFLTAALKRAGHDVTETKDGIEALKTLDSALPFDLLLTDIVMPGIDGIELSQKATDLRPDLKVMFITGFAAVAISEHTKTRNNTKILSKPFHLNDLVNQVDILLEAA